ncbi:MAG TPA: TonB-dependent receptor [Gemmatimonadaceae bacterium]|nr:TonB-dependent receptor [Gemmatimonadaceae bacterium]
MRLGALLLLVAAGALRSQERTGRLTGVVHDDGGRPIENVEVTAIDQSKMVRTDSAGRFVFPALTPGTIALSLRRLAFEPAVVRTDVGEDDTLRVDVTLSVVAQRLSAVLVAERVEKGRTLVGFEMRRRQGVGHFVTRAQIEQRHPNLLSDMMRMVPGVVLLPGENGRQTLRFAGVSRASCPPMYYLDGILAVGFTIDEIPPGDVEGVELYGGAAGVPPEYSRSRGTSNCGTVLIWSRIPGF